MGFADQHREELQDGPVPFLRVADVDAVRRTLDDVQRRRRDRRVRPCTGALEGDGRIAVAVDDEGRDGDVRQVVAEVGVRERRHGLERGGLERLVRERESLLTLLLRDLQLAVHREEVGRELVVERVLIRREPGRHLRGLGDREGPVRVSGRLQQVRRNRGGEDRAVDALRTVAAEVPGDLTATHREPDERHVAQVERFEHRLQVVGEPVVAVTGERLVAATEAAAIVGDDAVACGLEGRDLFLPRRTGQRPTVDEDDRASRATGVVDV